jgi:hypothetical protein
MIRLALITLLIAGALGSAIFAARTLGASRIPQYISQDSRLVPRSTLAQVLLALPDRSFRLGDAITVFGMPQTVSTCYRSVYVVFRDITLIANAGGAGKPFHPYMPIDTFTRRNVNFGIAQHTWRGFNTWDGMVCQ